MSAMETFDRLVRAAHAAGASDLHLVPDQRPRARVPQEGLRPLEEEPCAPELLEELARELFGERGLARQREEGFAVTSFRLEDGLSFGRATLATTHGHYSVSVRFATGGAFLEGLTLERLGLPDEVAELLARPHGLIVVSGPHGSGKTTTLYALLQWINAHRAVHVCTVEDPICFWVEPGEALLQQRQVGTDVPDVAAGIAAAMDQDLDVLVVTELRDLEALTAALHAAETGHLVLIQVHAASAADALERLVEAAPTDLAPTVRRTLSESLQGVLNQRLVPKRERGRVAVYELLLPDDALRATLASGGRVADQRGAPGSFTLRESLERLTAAGTVAPEVAASVRRSLPG